jgi:hypothetical protein
VNPSTSSNADPTPDAAFKVSLRQLTPDLSEAGANLDPRDLGQIGAMQLDALFAKLVAFTPDKLIDADPHLVISARRGRFLVRPARGKLRLYDGNDLNRDPLEIEVGQATRYLNGSELKSGEEADAISPPSSDTSNPRMALAATLLLLSIGLVSASAYLTFKHQPIDSEVEYTAVASAQQMAALRDQVTATFVTGTGDGSRQLIFRADGAVTWIERGPDNSVADERLDTYKFVLRGDTPVARTTWLGPIDIRDAKTVFYAGEVYTRQP